VGKKQVVMLHNVDEIQLYQDSHKVLRMSPKSKKKRRWTAPESSPPMDCPIVANFKKPKLRPRYSRKKDTARYVKRDSRRVKKVRLYRNQGR
jgi:hypothetical protein